MEVKLGSVPVEGWGPDSSFLLEVFQAEVTDPAMAMAYRIRIQVRREGERTSGMVPCFLTPSAARALAALLTLPPQTP